MLQNLAWATGYNALAIPLAAGVTSAVGFVLSPAFGAVLMSLSTIIVAINAQFLRRMNYEAGTYMHNHDEHEHHHHHDTEAADIPADRMAVCPLTGDAIDTAEAEKLGHFRDVDGKRFICAAPHAYSYSIKILSSMQIIILVTNITIIFRATGDATLERKRAPDGQCLGVSLHCRPAAIMDTRTIHPYRNLMTLLMMRVQSDGLLFHRHHTTALSKSQLV